MFVSEVVSLACLKVEPRVQVILSQFVKLPESAIPLVKHALRMVYMNSYTQVCLSNLEVPFHIEPVKFKGQIQTTISPWTKISRQNLT